MPLPKLPPPTPMSDAGRRRACRVGQLCALRGRVLRVQVSIRENGRFSRDEHRCPCLLIVDTRRALVRLWAWPLELVGYYCAQPTGEYSAGTTVAVPVGPRIDRSIACLAHLLAVGLEFVHVLAYLDDLLVLQLHRRLPCDPFHLFHSACDVRLQDRRSRHPCERSERRGTAAAAPNRRHRCVLHRVAARLRSLPHTIICPCDYVD